MSVRKPILLILTSRDETGECSQRIAEAVHAIGTHNVVILNDTQYAHGSDVARRRDALYDGAVEIYRDFLHKHGKLFSSNKNGKLTGSAKRIFNAVLRFRPEAIVCVTPFAHYAACDAKYKSRFTTPIIDVVMSFSANNNVFNDETNAYIVENLDVKQALIKSGAQPKNVMVMGLPVVIGRKTPIEAEAIKQDLGISRLPTFFMDVSGRADECEIYSLLADQGEIFNTIVFIRDSNDGAAIRKIITEKDSSNIQILSRPEQYDTYLTVSDFVITDYNAGVIYKCFKAGKPVICYDKHNEKELNYLVSKNLVLRAKEPIDVIDGVYTLMQSDRKAELVAAGEHWVEFNSIDNIANYLVSFIDTD